MAELSLAPRLSALLAISAHCRFDFGVLAFLVNLGVSAVDQGILFQIEWPKRTRRRQDSEEFHQRRVSQPTKAAADQADLTLAKLSYAQVVT